MMDQPRRHWPSTLYYSKIIWVLVFAGQYRNGLIWFEFEFLFQSQNQNFLLQNQNIESFKELKFWFVFHFQNAVVWTTKNAPSEIRWSNCALATAEQGRTLCTYIIENWNVMRFKNFFVKNRNIWVLILFKNKKNKQNRNFSVLQVIYLRSISFDFGWTARFNWSKFLVTTTVPQLIRNNKYHHKNFE